MIDLFRLKHVAGALAGTLSYGQQKLIDIAMAFMAAPAARPAGRTLRRRESEPVDQLRELLVELNRARAAASSSSSTTWIS
jgi:branched-chain amino acid transport system ATP-binding protein